MSVSLMSSSPSNEDLQVVVVALYAREAGGILCDSPFFSTIVLFQNQTFSPGFRRFLERMGKVPVEASPSPRALLPVPWTVLGLTNEPDHPSGLSKTGAHKWGGPLQVFHRLHLFLLTSPHLSRIIFSMT